LSLLTGVLLQPWITPSLFDDTGDSRIVDEWTFGQFQDHNIATNTLRHHWDTWITENDFADIAAAGYIICAMGDLSNIDQFVARLNHVRLPIGYWAFDVGPDEPFISGQIQYMEKAVSWARNHGLKLIIDLHGAPGSQNG
jgi:glucan 1,3-beta-glucosidase